MKPSIEAGDREFLERLRNAGSVTVQELCTAMGVTATAVRQRLVRLQALGLVDREIVRVPRGRPHHLYRITQSALRELGDNYADLALILWREMKAIEDETVRAKVVSRVRDAMAGRLSGVSGTASLERRMLQLKSSLEEHGFDVEVDQQHGLPVLREKNCPYIDLAQEDREVCELEQAVFSRVLGTQMQLTQCCLDGHSCCEFHAHEPQAVQPVG